VAACDHAGEGEADLVILAENDLICCFEQAIEAGCGHPDDTVKLIVKR